MVNPQRQLGIPLGKLLEEEVVREFATGLRGELIRPEDDGYDAARAVFNGMVNKRPAMIVRCAGTSDVIEGVDFARTHDLPLSVRGGGHSIAGKAVCDGGLMLDLSRMKGIRVDPVRRTAQAQPGLTLGEFDHETQTFGLATTLGIVSLTGIAGLTLGGGLGWLNGLHGLACDNLLSADVVTADGRLLKAAPEENEDLIGRSGAAAATSASSPRSSIGSIPSMWCWGVGCCFPRGRLARPFGSATSSRTDAPMSYPPRSRSAEPPAAPSWPALRFPTAAPSKGGKRCFVPCGGSGRRWKTTSVRCLTGRSRALPTSASPSATSTTGKRAC